MDAQSNGRNALQENEKAIITWIQQNTIPLQHIEAGNGFADLQPLRQILKEVKVVGLGEPTHGTREVFQLKHRLVEFLVTEMNFNTFAIEASFAACQPINEYVLYGKGDRAAVLTAQWYVPWDTEELSDLLDWLRAYNQSAPDEKKVKFHGLDITRTEIGRQAVLAYLRKVAPDRLATTEMFFAAFAREDAKWSLRIDEETEKTLVQLLPQLQEIIDHLTANKERFVSHSSLQEFDQALQYTRVMQQFIMANVTALLPPSQNKRSVRSISMAENLIYLADQARPDAKFMVWEHNWHIRIADHAIEAPNMGSYVRAKYGSEYFAFGFEFNQGSFQTRTALPDKLSGDLKEVNLPPAPAKSFPWYLAQTNLGVFILNLRTPVPDPVVEQWLATPQPAHFVAWRYNAAAQDYLELDSIRKYDGIIFIESTTASRPTANALRTVANRDGL
jgi:erythromycin esterase